MTKVYDIRIIEQSILGTDRKIVGSFKFDGRTKAGQEGQFVHFPDQGKDSDPYLNFTFFNVRNGQKIRKTMKECQQKTDILRQLEDYLVSELKSDPESDYEEYGVETERELAAIEAATESDPQLRKAAIAAFTRDIKRVPVEAALGKHHDDLLEIPDFLKRA